MNCMKRFTTGVLDDKYMVFTDEWHKESDFATQIIKQFNANTGQGGSAPNVEPMGNWPTAAYLMDMTRQFMMRRYGWEESKSYRRWCKENPGKILVVEVFGSEQILRPTSLEMKYVDGFYFKLM